MPGTEQRRPARLQSLLYAVIVYPSIGGKQFSVSNGNQEGMPLSVLESSCKQNHLITLKQRTDLFKGIRKSIECLEELKMPEINSHSHHRAAPGNCNCGTAAQRGSVGAGGHL